MSGSSDPGNGADRTAVKLGARLRCSVCGSEAVVTKLGDAPSLVCHGQPLEAAVTSPGSAG